MSMQSVLPIKCLLSLQLFTMCLAIPHYEVSNLTASTFQQTSCPFYPWINYNIFSAESKNEKHSINQPGLSNIHYRQLFAVISLMYNPRKQEQRNKKKSMVEFFKLVLEKHREGINAHLQRRLISGCWTTTRPLLVGRISFLQKPLMSGTLN